MFIYFKFHFIIQHFASASSLRSNCLNAIIYKLCTYDATFRIAQKKKNNKKTILAGTLNKTHPYQPIRS